jgi:ABC-type branched-subunit amino acid transport system ATPase component
MLMPLLEVSDLRVSYGKALAIESVSIKVDKGELVGVLGPNGAGKTTLLKAISRSIGSQGKLLFKDQSLDGVAPYDVVARGICHCPEGRKLFSELSVLKTCSLAPICAATRPRSMPTLSAYSHCSRCCANGNGSSPAHFRAANSRWSRSAAP